MSITGQEVILDANSVQLVAQQFGAGTRIVKGQVVVWQGLNLHKITVRGDTLVVDSTCLAGKETFQSLTELESFFDLIERRL